MKATLAQMQAAVSKWNGIRSTMGEALQQALANDNECDDSDFLSLNLTLESLIYRVGRSDIGDEAQRLYRCLEGNYFPTPATAIAYWTTTLTNDAPNEADILANWNQVHYTLGESFVIPYIVQDGSERFLRFATVATELEKNFYVDLAQPSNQASIGTEEDLYNHSTTLTTLKHYCTNFLTSYYYPPEVTPQGLRFETR